jgi:acetyl esterase/lipase
MREAPARPLPTPETVSPQMQKLIGAPLNTRWKLDPKTPEEWHAIVDRAAQATVASLARIKQDLGVKVEPATMAGVPVFIVTPATVPDANRGRVLLHLHGGIRVFNPGEAGTLEAVLMAAYAGYRVVSVDYRMPPDHPFPAALDDAFAVYRELLKTTEPRRVGVFGTSAGGSLVLTMLLKAKSERLPMPAVMALGTPTVDLTRTGDSLSTNAMVDNVLVTQDGFIRATGLLYANGRDLRDPLLSPIYGDVTGFPPAILTSGTRDLYLSNTVRMHRKLRDAGVEADLNVWEGQSHAQYLGDHTAPETLAYHRDVARFLDKHLDR